MYVGCVDLQRELRKDRMADPAEILKDCEKPTIGEGHVLNVGCVDQITIRPYSVESIELFILTSAVPGSLLACTPRASTRQF